MPHFRNSIHIDTNTGIVTCDIEISTVHGERRQNTQNHDQKQNSRFSEFKNHKGIESYLQLCS